MDSHQPVVGPPDAQSHGLGALVRLEAAQRLGHVSR
jgi:hypothetical protein